MTTFESPPLFTSSLVGEPDDGLDLDGRTTPACYRPAPHPPRQTSNGPFHRRAASGHYPSHPPTKHQTSPSVPGLPPVRSSSTATAIDASSTSAILVPRTTPFQYGTPATDSAPSHDASGLANYFPPAPVPEHSEDDTPKLSAPVRPQARRGSFNLPREPKRDQRSRRSHRVRASEPSAPRHSRAASESDLMGLPSNPLLGSPTSPTRSRYSSVHRTPPRVQLRRWISAALCTGRTLAWLLLHPRAASIQTGRTLARWSTTLDSAFRDPRTGDRTWNPTWIQAYIPFLIWLGVSLTSTMLVILNHAWVFATLDHLAQILSQWGWKGKWTMGLLIGLTSIPPVPLYSTLVVLSGYAFGLWPGFWTAYLAALMGGISVFLASRSWLRGPMQRLLAKSPGLQKIVRAIDKQPRLLFLIRLAPYPYNLLNMVLAASPTLTLRTYSLCTACALPKLLVHVAIGAMTKSFASPAAVEGHSNEELSGQEGQLSPLVAGALRAKHFFGVGGVLLCIGIFFYLLSVARHAVDELDEQESESSVRHGEYHPLALRPRTGGVEALDHPQSDWSDSSELDSDQDSLPDLADESLQPAKRSDEPGHSSGAHHQHQQAAKMTIQTSFSEGMPPALEQRDATPGPSPSVRMAKGRLLNELDRPYSMDGWSERDAPAPSEILLGLHHRRTPSRAAANSPPHTHSVSADTLPHSSRKRRTADGMSISTSIAPSSPSLPPSQTASPAGIPFSPNDATSASSPHSHSHSHSHLIGLALANQTSRLPSPLAQRNHP